MYDYARYLTRYNGRMADELGVREFLLHGSEYLDAAGRGATFLITRRGRPLAIVGPARKPDLPTTAYMAEEDWAP